MDVGLVCDSCDTLNSFEASTCSSCGKPLAGPLAEASNPSVEKQRPPMKNCPQCNAEIPESFRFCGNCGEKMPDPDVEATGNARTIFFGAMQAPNRAKLILIKGEGLDGISYHLNATEHVVGREEGAILFPEDPILSPRHACFFYQENQLYVQDEGSINGVFVRLMRSIPLVAGSRFLVGEQLMQFEPCNETELSHQADEEGTYFYCSPIRPSRLKLIHILRGGDISMIHRAVGDEITLGREECDINFPDDPYISGKHAMVKATADGYLLSDVGSKNGTYYMINGSQKLEHGDYVFLGQQLLRVEIS